MLVAVKKVVPMSDWVAIPAVAVANSAVSVRPAVSATLPHSATALVLFRAVEAAAMLFRVERMVSDPLVAAVMDSCRAFALWTFAAFIALVVCATALVVCATAVPLVFEAWRDVIAFSTLLGEVDSGAVPV